MTSLCWHIVSDISSNVIQCCHLPPSEMFTAIDAQYCTVQARSKLLTNIPKSIFLEPIVNMFSAGHAFTESCYKHKQTKKNLPHQLTIIPSAISSVRIWMKSRVKCNANIRTKLWNWIPNSDVSSMKELARPCPIDAGQWLCGIHTGRHGHSVTVFSLK